MWYLICQGCNDFMCERKVNNLIYVFCYFIFIYLLLRPLQPDGCEQFVLLTCERNLPGVMSFFGPSLANVGDDGCKVLYV